MTEQEMQKRITFLEGRLNEVKLQYVDAQMGLESAQAQLSQTKAILENVKSSEKGLWELLREAIEFEQMLFDYVAAGVPIPAPTTTRARIIAALEDWRYKANQKIG